MEGESAQGHSSMFGFAAVTPRQILGVAGQINSLALVLGPKALIDTKIFYKEVLPFITNHFSWGKSLHISTTLRDALFAWQHFILDFCGFRSFASKGSPIVIFSDASAVSSGAFIAAPRDRNSKDKFLLPEQGSPKDICLRSWSSEEKSLSSTWRELKIVEEALRAFRKQLKGMEVHWFLDNLGGTSVVCRGSLKENLNPLVGMLYLT